MTSLKTSKFRQNRYTKKVKHGKKSNKMHNLQKKAKFVKNPKKIKKKPF